MPFEAVIRRPPSASEVDKADYISDLHAKLHFVHEIARQNHTTSAEYQKRNYDLKVIKKSSAVGQLVWLYEPLKKKGVCKKLTCP